MGNIGLIDIDSHSNFPNLALMKLSAWHKQHGDKVFLLKPNDILLGSSLFTTFDKLYASCIFDWNRSTAVKLAAMDVEVGGSGISMKKKLPLAVEQIYPDYSLYGITDIAYGFLTRGCPRHCPFCIVGDKEGLKSYKVANLSQFWRKQKNIKLLDPNILACQDHMNLLSSLAESGAYVDFTQGLDARLLTDENIAVLNQIKVKMIHFAWDNPKDFSIKDKLLYFRKKSVIKDGRKLRVYVLVNYWSTLKEDLNRIMWLRGNDYDPYVMIFDKKKCNKIYKFMQRWVNNKFIWRSCDDFIEYLAVNNKEDYIPLVDERPSIVI